MPTFDGGVLGIKYRILLTSYAFPESTGHGAVRHHADRSQQ